jgi:hypothetical protein
MASKGKSKLASNETAKLKKSTTIYENALDNAYYINAQMKNNGWFLARIIDCKLMKGIFFYFFSDFLRASIFFFLV